MPIDITRRLSAEFFGTFWLTFAGCGSAVLAAAFPSLGRPSVSQNECRD
jgi:aquaporin Z